MVAAGDAASEPEEVAYLWPCNVDAWNVWCELQTQWNRAGMSGARSGLRYEGVRAHLDELGLCGDERREIYDGVRAAECATLDAQAELAEQEERNNPQR